MNSPITNVKHLEDRVRINYHLRQPYGVPDEDGVREILYSQIGNLPRPPEIPKNRTDACWEELINIRIGRVDRTVCFRFTSMRSGGGPPEENLDGPYLGEGVGYKYWNDDMPYCGSSVYTYGMIRRGEDPYHDGNVDEYGNAIHD